MDDGRTMNGAGTPKNGPNDGFTVIWAFIHSLQLPSHHNGHHYCQERQGTKKKGPRDIANVSWATVTHYGCHVTTTVTTTITNVSDVPRRGPSDVWALGICFFFLLYYLQQRDDRTTRVRNRTAGRQRQKGEETKETMT